MDGWKDGRELGGFARIGAKPSLPSLSGSPTSEAALVREAHLRPPRCVHCDSLNSYAQFYIEYFSVYLSH